MSVTILGQSISKGKRRIRKFGLGGDAFQPLRHIGDDRIAEAARALGISSINKPEEVSRIVNWRPAPPAPAPAPPPAPEPEPTPATVDPSFASDSNNPEVTPEPEPQGMTPFEYDYQREIDLANIDKDINDMRNKSNEYIKQIEGETFTKVETIRAGASKYSDDLQKEVDLYDIDKKAETALGVENIRAQAELDLQDVINAGLKDVEIIRDQSARDVAKIRGEFDIQTEEIKGKTERDVARIDRDKGIYGSLISAFQF